MKTFKKIRFCLSFLAVLSGINTFASGDITLQQAYESAMAKTEAMPIQNQKLIQFNEKIAQAKAAIFPKISFNASYFIQDGLNQVDKPYVFKLTGVQSLYHGLKEFKAIESSELDFKSQETISKSTKLNIYLNVAQSFFTILSIQKDIDNLKNILDVSNKRIVELRSRAQIGRSRKGDLLAAQAQVALYKSQIDSLSSQLDQAMEQFGLITGIESDQKLINIQLKDGAKIPNSVHSLKSYTDQIEQRPDVENAKLQLQSSDKNIDIAKTGHYPGLDLLANYYVARNGSLENSKWDFGLNFSFPIFSGFLVDSQVKESLSKFNEKELILTQTRKNAEKEIKSAYKNFNGKLSQLNALNEVLKISEQNYKEQMRDYGFGLATNLDVLQALNSYYDTKRSYDKTLYQAKLSVLQLDIAIGRLP